MRVISIRLTFAEARNFELKRMYVGRAIVLVLALVAAGLAKC